jgi:AcrR family transcriptional regulator
MPRARAILDQAAVTAAFAPDGLHGVSAAEVAQRAGVAKPTLYAHGRSKEAVFAACVEAEVEWLLARLDTADRRTIGRPLHLRGAALALALLDHAARRPAAFRLLHFTAAHRRSAVAADVERALGRIPDRIAVALRRDLAEERAAGALPAARALHGAAVGIAAGGVDDRSAAAAMVGRGVAAALRPPAPEPYAPSHIELGVY